MTEDWRGSLDVKESVAVVAVDLSKAFDSVRHNLLLAKLKARGFSTSAMNLIRENLRGTSPRRVEIEGMCSEWKWVKAGVPQESLRGPLLFNIYINDVNYSASNMALRLYANDTIGCNSDASSLVLVHGQ